MGIYIPNMDKPERCMYCIAFTLQEAPTHYAYDEPPYVYPYCELLEREVDDDTIPNDCPLIEIVQCKDCKWFELDVWGKLNGIPVIVAHEMCDFWGGGCKTNPNGFCSYGEREGE